MTSIEEARAALEAAGYVVLPEGTTSRTEYAMQVEGHAAPWGLSRNRERTVDKLNAHRETWPDHPAHLVERQAHETPWQPAQPDPGAGDAGT